MGVNIRMADLPDIDSLIAVRFDYFEAEKWEITPEQRLAMKPSLRQYFQKHLDIDFFAALVENDGTIASAAFLAIFEKPASLSFPTGKTGMILNVLTYPDYRKRGFATRTLELLVKEAKNQNLSYIELSASESGKPIYEKLGFQEIKSSRFTEMKLSLI